MPAPDVAWCVLVVPVKDGRLAKSRLGAFASNLRPELARAMAADCVAAALGSALVRAVVAVTDDEAAAEQLRGVGAHVVPDTPRAGLNAALVHGAAHAATLGEARRVGALSGDLPALRPAELTAALRAAPAARCFVADAAGTGTTLLMASSGGALDPRFGPNSRVAHRASGAVEISAALPSLRRDVDTAEDLRAAVALGVGPRTRGVLARLGANGAGVPGQ